jgi:hypothetical protein
VWTEEDEEEAKRNAMQAALSAGVAGSAYGSGFGLLGGATSTKQLAKLAAKSGSLSALLGGGGVYLGSKLLGNPSDEESTGFTRRASLGSGLVGAGLGSAAGAFAGSGLVPKSVSANPSLLSQYVAKLSRAPSAKKALIGAALGGLAGSVGGTAIGSDEGMVIDFINEERKRQMMKKRTQGLESNDDG